MEPRDVRMKNMSRERDLLLENLRANENDAFEELAERFLANPDVDVDFEYPHPLNKTLLDVASCEGRVHFVDILLKLGADVNRINNDYKRGPIHFAAEAGNPQVLERLLEDRRSNPDLEAGDQTALHIAVRNKHPECVKILLDNGANPNRTNAKGLTPLHVAASNSQRDIVHLIFKHSKWAPNIDDFRDFRKRTTREVLQEKMPGIELSSIVIESKIDIEDISSFDGNDETQFLENLRKIENTRLGNFDELLKITAKRDFPEAARELMRKRLTCDASRISDPATFAVELGHHRVVKEILATESKLANELLITACKELGVPNSHEQGHEDDRIKCLRVILEQPDVNVRCEDDKGNTPLHYAARAESSEAVSMLLRTGSYIGHRNVLGVPPLAHMSPSALSSFFDDCLRGENERTDEYEIRFDYRCLMPHSVDISCRLSDDSRIASSPNNLMASEMDALAFISSNPALKPLLKHPLLSSFLYLKWHRIRHVLYANFIFYVIFYALMNAYILSTSCNHTSNNFTADYNSMPILPNVQDSHALKSFTASILMLLTLREALQLISSPFRYISCFENLLELALIILGAWTIASPNPQIGAIVILLSAWELVILIGQHPRMSTGIEMFKTVSINFLRFLFLYAFLILAFALAFFTLFRNSEGDENFPDPGRSLFKTIIMLTGEFDANDIPFLAHPILSHCIFVLFVFLIAIVLFNLLNGLAVSDTADILNKSELVGLVSRTKLIYYAESVALGSGFIRFTGQSFNPLRFLVKKISLFSDYLPQGKLGVKPYKSNKIQVYGRSKQTKNCKNRSMDPWIVTRTREILNQRGNVTENEKIIAEIKDINRKLERIENIMDSMRLALENNNS